MCHILSTSLCVTCFWRAKGYLGESLRAKEGTGRSSPPLRIVIAIEWRGTWDVCITERCSQVNNQTAVYIG